MLNPNVLSKTSAGRPARLTAVSNQAEKTAINVDSVSMKFAGRQTVVTAVRDLSFSVGAGEFVSIVGPSGCGKSTCLGMIAGLLKPTHGKISVNGDTVTGPRRDVGFMLQRDLLMPWRTVLENVVFGLEIRDVPKTEMKDRAEAYLSAFGLSEFANHRPGELSGGMRQRVSLIRTLLTDPDIILLDEPFSALDFQTRLVLEDELWLLMKKEKRTVVLITHDINEAVAMSDRVLVISKRPGELKSMIEVGLAHEAGSPLEARNLPSFSDYFSHVWKELDVDVHRRDA